MKLLDIFELTPRSYQQLDFNNLQHREVYPKNTYKAIDLHKEAFSL